MGIDVMVDKNRCTGTTTNDDGTKIDNCGADGCEVVEAEKKMTGFYFDKQYKHTGRMHNKKEHVPGMERTALEITVSQNRGECLSRIPSESNVAC